MASSKEKEEKEPPNHSRMRQFQYMLRFHNLEASHQKSKLHITITPDTILASLDLSTNVLIFSILQYQNGLELTSREAGLPCYALSAEHWKAFLSNAIVPWPQQLCLWGRLQYVMENKKAFTPISIHLPLMSSLDFLNHLFLCCYGLWHLFIVFIQSLHKYTYYV